MLILFAHYEEMDNLFVCEDALKFMYLRFRTIVSFLENAFKQCPCGDQESFSDAESDWEYCSSYM